MAIELDFSGMRKRGAEETPGSPTAEPESALSVSPAGDSGPVLGDQLPLTEAPEHNLDFTGMRPAASGKLRQRYNLDKESPDTKAKIFDIMSKTQLPEPVVRGRLPDAEQRANEPDWMAFERDAPVASRAMSEDPQLFSLSKDVTEEVKGLEAAVKAATSMVEAFKRAPGLAMGGFHQARAAANVESALGTMVTAERKIARGTQPTTTGRGLGGVERPAFSVHDYNPAATMRMPAATRRMRESIDTAAKHMKLAQRYPESEVLRRVSEAEGLMAAMTEIWDQGVVNVTIDALAASAWPMAEVLASAAAGQLIGGPLGGVAAGTAGRGLGTAFSSYKVNYDSKVMEYLMEEGVDPRNSDSMQALLRDPEALNRVMDKASAFAMGPAVFDTLATLVAGVPLAASPVRNVLGQTTVQGLAGGTGEAAGQVMAEGDVTSWGEVLIEGLAETPGGIVETMLARRLADNAKAAQSDDFKNRMDEVAQMAGASKLRERSPEKFEQLVRKMLQEGVDTVYLDAQEFVEFFQSQGVDPMEAASQLSGVAEQLPEALARQGSVRVDTAEFVSRMGPTEYYQGLSEIMKQHSSDMSQREATEWRRTEGERFRQLAERIANEHANDTEFQQSVERVETYVADQLRGAGRDNEAAELNARAYGAFTSVIAHRLKILPHQVLEMYGVEVTGGPGASRGGMQLDQARVADSWTGPMQGALFPDSLVGPDDVVTLSRPVSTRGDVQTVTLGNTDASGRQITATRQGLENFWAFYEGSVVDDVGRPVPMYHSTDQDISQFETMRDTKNVGLFGVEYDARRAGIFFTPDPQFAQGYREGAEGQNVVPTYLQIRNPVDLRNGAPEGLGEELSDFGYNPKLLQSVQYAWELFDEEFGGPEFVRALKEAGYDGAIISEESQEGLEADVYVVFDPTQIKSAIGNRGTFDPNNPDILFQSETSAQAEDRAWANWKPEVTSTGKIKGAPEWVKDDKDLQAMYRQIRARIKEGVSGRYWYEDSARAVMALVQGDVVQAEKFIQLLAIYSPQATVQVNTYFAISAWNQWKSGIDPKDFKVKTGDQDQKAVGVLYKDTPFDGRKTSSFYLNLMHDIVASDPAALEKLQLPNDLVEELNKPATIDLWLYRAFGYANEAAGNDKGTGRYSFAENAVRRLTARLNQARQPGEPRWTPHQVQAAVWTAMKSRYEIPTVKQKTWTESLKAGLAWIDDKGKLRTPTTVEGMRKHRALWRKQAMKVTSAEAIAAAEANGASFRDFIDQTIRTVTWEAMPSAAIGHPIGDAPLEVRQQFTNEVRHLFVDEAGHDLLAALLGVPLAWASNGLGAYEGAVSPNVLSHLVPTKESGSWTRDTVQAYARAVQYVTQQDAVPWFRADSRALTSKNAQDAQKFRIVNPATGRVVPGTKVDTLAEAQALAAQKGYSPDDIRGGPYAVGAKFTFGRDIDGPAALVLLESLQEFLGEGVGFTRTGPREITIINFRDDETGVPFVDDAVFDARLDEARSALEALGLETAESGWFEGEYGYVHDWAKEPAGEGVLDQAGLAGQPVLQEWVRARRREYEAILDRYRGGTFFQSGSAAQERGRAERGDSGRSTPPVREDGRVELTHWSRAQGIEALDPSYHGKGIAGAESRRKNNNPDTWVDRTYYGLALGEEFGYRRERSLGPDRYTVSIEPERLYDMAADPDGLYPESRDNTEYERAIRDAGYAGYWVNNPSLGMVAAVFETLPVETYTNERPPALYQEQTERQARAALEKQAEENFWALLEADPEGAVDTYLSRVGPLVDPDEAKKLSPEYAEDPSLAPAVHEPSSALAKMVYARLLEQADGRPVLFTAGGGGSGKTEALPRARQLLGDPDISLLYDSVMSNPESAFRRIDQALAAGVPVRIAYTNAPVEKAFRFALGRDRVVPATVLAKAHVGASDTIRRIQERYLGNPMVKISVVNNFGTREEMHEGDLISVPHYVYTDVVKRLEEIATDAYQDGTITAENLARVLDRGVPQDGQGQPGRDDGGTQRPVRGDGERGRQADARRHGGTLAQEARGSVQFPADLTQGKTLISLFEGADLSTFLHETGHFFFEVYRDLASRPDANPDIAADMQALLEFIDVPSLEAWNAMTPEQRRDGHEKVARAFEAYLFEGKAPSPGLRDLFRTFSNWLVQVYKSITNLDVDLTPEVRQVFDRMLATEQEIEAMQALREYAPLFESMDQSNMDPESWAEYQALGLQATEDASFDLQRRSLQDMRWLQAARAREIKKLQADARAKRKAVRAEIEDEVYRRPLYAAMRFLTHGDTRVEDMTRSQRRIAELAAMQPHKLDKGALREMYGDGPAAPWRYLSTGKFGLMAQEGLHPDDVAELFGFDSGDALVKGLLDADPVDQVIDQVTDAVMMQRYGDLNNPAVIEHAADQAVHNEARMRFLATELRALDSLANVRGEAGTDARGRRRTYNVLAAAAKAFADQAIGRKTVRDAVRTSQYAAAETRAGKAAQEAMRRGDIQTAAEHKRAQVLNAHFFRSAAKAQEDVDKIVRYLKKFNNEGTRKNLDKQYLDQIDQLLEMMDMRASVTQKALQKRQELRDWITAQEEQGFNPAIDPKLLEDSQRKHYTEYTVDELRGLRDAVKSIEHLGRLKKKLLTAKDKREFDAIIDDAVAEIEARAKKGKRPREIETDLPQDRLKRTVGEFFASHRKLADLFREMDGWQDGGPMWELMMRPLNEAADKEAVMREEATVALRELFVPLHSRGRLYKKEYIPEINASLTKMGRLSVALNLGNDTNRLRIQQGYGWSPEQIDAILSPLTKEDWDFVQAVWDLIDGYWGEIEAKEIRVNGVAPEKVQAVPVVTPFGEYRGGYYPIKYDIEQSPRAYQDATAEAAKEAMRGARASATTRRGHVKQRVEEVKRPVQLSFSTIFTHLEQVIHDLAFHEYLIDQARVLRDSRMQGAIVDYYGAETLRQIQRGMEVVAAGDVPATLAHERVANWLRTGASIAAMAWKLSTALVQPLGLTQSIVRIGPKWIAKGMARWATNEEGTLAWVYERSPMMRLRGKTLQREISEIRNRISKESWFQRQLDSAARVIGAEHAPDIQNSFFWMIAKTQILADMPTWLGMYEKAMAQGVDESKAIAMADQAVLDSQGGGQVKDLAAVQRGSPWFKLWTNFYSYFNTTYNRTVESVKKTQWSRPASIGRLGVDLLMLYTIPSAIATLVFEVMKDNCDGDWDCIARSVAKDQATYMLGTMVGLRELQGVFSGFNYQGPAGTRFFAEAVKLGRQIEQGEIDEAFVRAGIKTGGVLFHYPAGQIDATLQGIMALQSGEADRPTAIGFGAPYRE